MKIVSLILQVLVALGLLNVWLLRFGKPTPYRGGRARSMPEEFAAYGLPHWSLWVIGGLKVSCALALLIGVWAPTVVAPAAILIAILMIGAITMHFKVHDPLMRSIPASLVLGMAAVILFSAA